MKLRKILNEVRKYSPLQKKIIAAIDLIVDSGNEEMINQLYRLIPPDHDSYDFWSDRLWNRVGALLKKNNFI